MSLHTYESASVGNPGAYAAAMIEWNERQDRARKATAAYNRHVNRNKPKAKAEPRATYVKAYYDGGFRMVIDGVPCRFAAFVKRWKKSNRDALCQGFDPFGLEIERPPKRAHWGWIPSRFEAPEDAYWQLFHPVCELKTVLPEADVLEMINSGEYDKWRRGYHAALFDNRREAEREHRRVCARAARSPSLFGWARLQRRLAKSKGDA